jgi:hypothetical protein
MSGNGRVDGALAGSAAAHPIDEADVKRLTEALAADRGVPAPR